LWLAIFCASATHFGRVSNVLCVSASGHVEIETGGDDCCKDAHTPARELSVGDRCDCIDTPLVQTAARSGVGTERLMTGWMLCPEALLDPGAICGRPTTSVRARISAGPPCPSVTVARLRTVVLLA